MGWIQSDSNKLERIAVALERIAGTLDAIYVNGVETYTTDPDGHRR